MANVISVTVYDFSTVGNKLYERKLMGLPVAGMFVEPVSDRARPDSSVYVYSIIRYPGSGVASPQMNGYYTAESVQAIINKANA